MVGGAGQSRLCLIRVMLPLSPPLNLSSPRRDDHIGVHTVACDFGERLGTYLIAVLIGIASTDTRTNRSERSSLLSESTERVILSLRIVCVI